ncbi:hypothetical protein ACQP2X_49180 [Actinoplanes sp. CA-131856]
MKRFVKAGRLLVAGALAAVCASLGLAAPAQAAIPGVGWYMLVNDYYDGGSGHDDGVKWCLSTNADTSPAGSGTHKVYLAKCNTSTPAQWWYLRTASGFDTNRKLVNYQNFGGEVWELSSNSTTPSGWAANTYAAYTAQQSSAVGHVWSAIEYTEPYKFRFQNLQSGSMLSTSHNNPYSGGVFKVYTAGWQIPVPPAHLWRFWQPGGRPSCSPCGALA